MTATDFSERPGFEVEETADTLLITFPNGPRIHIVRLLAEIMVLWLAFFALAFLWLRLLEGYATLCLGIASLWVLLGSASLILWNYLTVDRIKVDNQWLELQRGLVFFRPRNKQRLRPEVVKRLRPVAPAERITTLHRVFGLRLIFLHLGGNLAIETSHNMTLYIGWGASQLEVEHVIALIQQRFPQYGQLP